MGGVGKYYFGLFFSLDSFSILQILFGYFHPYRIRQFPEEVLSPILLFHVLGDDIIISFVFYAIRLYINLTRTERKYGGWNLSALV